MKARVKPSFENKVGQQISKVTTVNTCAKYYRRFTEEVLTELVLKKHFDFCHMDK